MSQWQLSRSVWEQMFSAVLVMDNDFQLLHISDCISKYMPTIATGESFEQYFNIHRPTGVLTAQQIRNQTDSLYILIANDKQLALRGQIASIDEHTLGFLGSPWLAWMSKNRPDVNLSITDFSIQDAQLDQQFFIASNQLMVNDLETINAKLQQARDTAEMANRAKTDFLGLMSHEMRTPLNGIVSSLTLLGDEITDDNQLALINTAQQSSIDLLSVINYVLSYANLELGNTTVADTPFDCHELFNSLADVLGGRASDKGLQLICEIEPSTPVWLSGDGEKLNHIITNFVTNAIKYTEHGQIGIHVTASGEDDKQATLRIEVRDSGIGISSEQLATVFEPMWSSETRVASQDTGVGVGIDICQQLTKMLDGQIGCDSELNVGSCFWVTVPFKVLSVAPVQQQRTLPENTRLDVVKFSGRVLVADDNHVNLMLAQMILTKLGLQVQTVSNGKEAVDCVAQVPFDIVLMDVSMPIMDGIEATQLIRQLSDHSHTPVVALTAHSLPGDRERLLEKGMDDFLSKPIIKHDLVCVLSQYVPQASPDSSPSSTKISNTQDAEDIPLICDEAILKALCDEIGGANLDKVVSLFFSEADSRLPQILEFSDQEDWTSVAKQAHALASSAKSFGAMQLGTTLKNIEQSIKTDNAHPPLQSINKLSNIYKQSVVELNEAAKKIANATH